MASTVATARSSDPVPSLDGLRPTPAKAGLRGDQRGPSVCTVMAEAVIAHYGGSVKEAAFALQVDRSLMMREFKAGDFHRIDALDDVAKAAIFAAVHEAFGPLTTVGARARHLFQQRRKLDQEIEQLVFCALGETA